jgi:predicted nucleotidyltransferase
MNDGAKILEKDKVLETFVRELRKALGSRLKRVILYGSRARGDDSSDSDYDILAIVDEVSPSLRDIVDSIAGNILYEYNVLVSVFPISEDRYEYEIYNPLLMNIRKEGILI